MKTATISMTINGRAYGPDTIPADLSMNDYLRDYCGLTGTKFGCGIGECRACVVMIDHDDRPPETRRTCITGALAFDGQRIRTIEGHARDGVLSPLQLAFLDHFAFQCGYCTSGFLAEGQALLERLARAPIPADAVDATVDDALKDHVCRCTGYARYRAAVKAVIHADGGMTR